MVRYGCCARLEHGISRNVEFAEQHGFDLLQIWYDRAGFGYGVHKTSRQHLERLAFPSVIHAVLEVHELVDELPVLCEHLMVLGHDTLILHPTLRPDQPYQEGDFLQQVGHILPHLEQGDLRMYVENNCCLMPVMYRAEEVRALFRTHPCLEFLLDVAHIDNYQHLHALVAAKHPTMLHLADSHFAVAHEHLPLGHGAIDFSYVLTQVLHDFDGTIIFEIVQSDAHILAAKAYVSSLLAHHNS